MALACSVASRKSSSLSPVRGSIAPAGSSLDGKDFFSGFHKGQVGIVKLTSVQFLVVGAVQCVIIAGFRCLDIQIIATFQTVGGLLRGFCLFQRSIPGNGKALRLCRSLVPCDTSPVDFKSASIKVCSIAFTLSVISCCCSGDSLENTLSGSGCSAAHSSGAACGCSCWVCRCC